MGTNYYVHGPKCQECGRSSEPRHIGKSSGGWCFGLHVYPEEGIHDLGDWVRYWSVSDLYILNEYDDRVQDDEMKKIITERHWNTKFVHDDEFLAMNHAVRGPNNLLRHVNDGKFCIKHGDGTWDCLVGDFL